MQGELRVRDEGGGRRAGHFDSFEDSFKASTLPIIVESTELGHSLRSNDSNPQKRHTPSTQNRAAMDGINAKAVKDVNGVLVSLPELTVVSEEAFLPPHPPSGSCE